MYMRYCQYKLAIAQRKLQHVQLLYCFMKQGYDKVRTGPEHTLKMQDTYQQLRHGGGVPVQTVVAARGSQKMGVQVCPTCNKVRLQCHPACTQLIAAAYRSGKFDEIVEGGSNSLLLRARGED
jgi:hypothetical protein